MKQRTPLILGGMIVLTAMLLLGIVLDVSPLLRGPSEWRWHYGIPSRPARHLIPACVVAAYVAICMVWSRHLMEKETGPWARRAFLLFIVLSVPLIQASLYVVEDPDILEQPFYRTVSPTSSGVFSVGSTINEPIDYLRQYPQIMPSLPTHPQRYPPGLPLLFYGARRLLEQVPEAANAIASQLRLRQCHNLTLMRLPNATIASAIVQMTLPAVCGLTVLPVFGLARRAVGRKVALWAAMLYPLVPSFNLWFARWDAFYALLGALVWLLFYIGLVRFRHLALLTSGVLLSLGSFLSLGNLALLLPMGCWAILWLAAARDSWYWRRAAGAAVAFGIGVMSVWALYEITLDTGFLDIWRVSMSHHLGLARSYWLWLPYHLYDFFLFLGIPLTILFLASEAAALRGFGRQKGTLLPIAFGIGLLLLDLSGMSQGEVARVWLFLTPFATIVAADGLARIFTRSIHATLVFSVLAIQLLTFNGFLRVVNTGLYDPPDREPAFSDPAIAFRQEARLGDRITLLGYDVKSTELQPGDSIPLTLYWRASAHLSRAYTVFTHLVGPDGRVVAQQDNMPVKGTLPTTCWIPGEVIVDQYDITVDRSIPEGTYRLETGLYTWKTGERLPSSGLGAISDGRILLTEIAVERQ